MKIHPSFREGFLDGLGAGLFTRLRRPGAPDELIDSSPLEEFLTSDDFVYMKPLFQGIQDERRYEAEHQWATRDAE